MHLRRVTRYGPIMASKQVDADDKDDWPDDDHIEAADGDNCGDNIIDLEKMLRNAEPEVLINGVG